MVAEKRYVNLPGPFCKYMPWGFILLTPKDSYGLIKNMCFWHASWDFYKQYTLLPDWMAADRGLWPVKSLLHSFVIDALTQ
jgi:hypothetical protein